MRRIAWAPVLIVLAAACTDAGNIVAPVAPDAYDQQRSTLDSQEAARYIVVLNAPPSISSVTSASVAAAHGVVPEQVYRAALAGFSAVMTPLQAAELARNPMVALVEEDQIVHLTGNQSPVGSWGQDRIDQQSLPLDNSYSFPTTGAGVHFYGIDTGIRATHVEFTGRIGNGHTEIFDGLGTDDCHGHGTHTASTAAGAQYGVAKGMTVHAVRVLDCLGFGFTSGVIAGVDWVAANAQLPAVANMSLGGGASAALDAAVAAVVGQGVFMAVSAGNSAASACGESPAREPLAHTVASTTQTDQRSSFSNFGTCVDIFAPGSSITAAWATSDNATNTISGTSMASPHVAGVAGLILESDPSLVPAAVGNLITTNGTVGVVGNAGTGSPNLLIYMGFLGGGPPPPPPGSAPTADWTFQCDASVTCTFDGSPSMDDGSIVLHEWINAARGNTVATGQTFVRSFPGTRTISLTLTVTDDTGLVGSRTRNITVGPNLGDGGSTPPPPPPPPGNNPPVAAWTFVCDANISCTFDGASSSDDGMIVGWEWSAPKGVVSTSAAFTHAFPATRTLTLTLKVTDDAGLTDALTRTITVGPGASG